MKSPKFIYLDLDRTLIDTSAVMAALGEQCQSLYDVPNDLLQREAYKFYHHVGDLRYYDFFGQLQSYGVDPQQAREDLLANINQDFIYPDAHDMLRFLSETSYRLYVLSFGKHDFQQFKYQLAPQLHHMPFTSILYSKSRYLAESRPGPKLLVDDILTAPLPADCWQLWINRDAPELTQQLDPQHTKIRDLRQVEVIISETGNNL